MFQRQSRLCYVLCEHDDSYYVRFDPSLSHLLRVSLFCAFSYQIFSLGEENSICSWLHESLILVSKKRKTNIIGCICSPLVYTQFRVILKPILPLTFGPVYKCTTCK